MKNVILNSKVLKAITLTAGLFMGSFSAQADLVLSFDKDDIEVKLNETFTVNLYVDTKTPVDSILGWGLDAVFDNGVLALNSFTLGRDFMPGSSVDGDSLTGVAAIPTGVFGANILLGSFMFTAIDLGTTSLNTAHTVGDIFEGFTTTNFFNPALFNSAMANISVIADNSGTVSASAPATISLFAIAGLALFGFRRKA